MALRSNVNPSSPNSYCHSGSRCEKTFSKKKSLFRHLMNEQWMDGRQGEGLACSVKLTCIYTFLS